MLPRTFRPGMFGSLGAAPMSGAPGVGPQVIRSVPPQMPGPSGLPVAQVAVGPPAAPAPMMHVGNPFSGRPM